MIVDYHMHLRDERGGIDHSAAAAEKFVARAAERGVDEIGFTEHVYYFEQTKDFWPWPYYEERCHFDLDDYVGALVEAAGGRVKVVPGDPLLLKVTTADDLARVEALR